MTNRIQKLDQLVANQIAAGEVIERPANAVKELVENALDAGARRITVDIEEGGKKLIRVRDDGTGMNASDAVLSLQRHATSKLRDAEELFAIRTLGFRGEALPSIASVSRVQLTTREAKPDATETDNRIDEGGTRLVVEAGTVMEASDIGCAVGTEIAVHSLFFNTPARFKFLKSDSAEAGRIAEMLGHLALAYPNVAFQLRHNGTEMLRTEVANVESANNAFNALIGVMGRDTARQMLPIAPSSESAESDIKVSGFAGRPQLTRANRNQQIFFVNGRVIKNRSLQHAVAAAYEGLLHGHNRFPVAVIFIQLPANMVDVNVHPTKSEVRFAREWEVHHAVRIAIRETLVAAQLAPEWGLGETPRPLAPDLAPPPGTDASGAAPSPATPGYRPPTAPPPDYRGYYQPVAPRGGDIEQFRAAQGNFSQHNFAPRPASLSDDTFEGGHYNSGAIPPGTSPVGSPPAGSPGFGPPSAQSSLPELDVPLSNTPTMRPLAQISHNAYILCEADDGLYIVCQHRAHERILADRAIEAAEGRAVESQHLVIPFTVELGPRAAAAIDDNGSLLKDLGFEVEAFGGNAVLVRSVPALVANKDYEAAFTDLLDELIGGSGGRDLQERRRKLLTMLACKNAIKAGDPLQPEQMKNLLEDLMQLPNPSICPHGQPILIKISTLELDKKFEREYASR